MERITRLETVHSDYGVPKCPLCEEFPLYPLVSHNTPYCASCVFPVPGSSLRDSRVPIELEFENLTCQDLNGDVFFAGQQALRCVHVLCPWGCGTEVRRANLESHYQWCQEHTRPCIFGCGARVEQESDDEMQYDHEHLKKCPKFEICCRKFPDKNFYIPEAKTAVIRRYYADRTIAVKNKIWTFTRPLCRATLYLGIAFTSYRIWQLRGGAVMMPLFLWNCAEVSSIRTLNVDNLVRRFFRVENV